MRICRTAAACLLVVALAGAGGVAGEQTLPPAKDTIFARKILMGSIEESMDAIEGMLAPEGKFDSGEAREHADRISVLLMAFPHLFPAATNQWRAGADRDPARDTNAAPELWSEFADFYTRAGAATELAFAASRAATLEEFKGRVKELRAACGGCHARYLREDR